MIEKYFVLLLLLLSVSAKSKFLRNENYPYYLFSFENQTFVARPRNFTDDNYDTFSDEFFFDIGF
jgi:hypothetical protein